MAEVGIEAGIGLIMENIPELEQGQRDLLDAVEVGIMLGKNRDYVLRLCKKGKLPKPVKSVSRNRLWLADDIETWLSLGRPSQVVFEKWRKFNT